MQQTRPEINGVTNLAEELRKQSGGKQPITRHPLFTATVALWFGALFGLGSLAIRPGLLESAVLSTGLDSLISTAAPPLGWTARILLALALAAAGGLIGALLARFIARPKPVAFERKRGAASIAEEQIGSSLDQQDTGEPSSEDEEVARPVEVAKATAHANRRRQLALHDEARQPDYQDRAPVPGAAPQILDVTDFNLEGFEEASDDDAPVSAQDDRKQFKAAEPEIQDEMPKFAETNSAAALSNRLFDTYASESPAETQTGNEPPFGNREAVSPQVDDAKPGFAMLPRDAREDEPSALGAATSGEKTAPTLFDRPVPDAASEDRDINPFANADAEPTFDSPESPAFGPTADNTDDFWDEDEAADAEPVQHPADFPGELMNDRTGIETISELSVQDDAAIAEEKFNDSPDDLTHTQDLKQPATDGETDMPGAERIANADLSELSHAELLERLAHTLERRRQQSAGCRSCQWRRS